MLSRLKQQIIEVSNTTSSAHNHDSIKDLTVLDSPMVNNSSSSSSSRPLEQHPSRHHNNKSGSSRRSASSIRPEAPRTPTVSQKNFQEVQFIDTLIFLKNIYLSSKNCNLQFFLYRIPFFPPTLFGANCIFPHFKSKIEFLLQLFHVYYF